MKNVLNLKALDVVAKETFSLYLFFPFSHYASA